MFFQDKKETPVAKPAPVSRGTQGVEVCAEHRIIGCRTCWPPEEPKAVVTPGVEVNLVEKVELSAHPNIDATTLTFMVWLMYKLDIITRIQIRDFLTLIKDGKWPTDVVKFMQDEVKKL